MTIQTTNIDVTTGDAFDLTVAEQAYIVDSGVSVLAEEGGQNGISSVFDFNEIMNYGQVSAPNDGIHMGSGGEGGQIVNEASGSITANNGIVVETADNYIENDGRISAFGIGIDDDASSGNDIFNTGSILAKGTGIDADSDDFVDNTGTIRSDSIGVALNAGTGAISLTNAGAIHGSLESVQSSGASAVSIVVLDFVRRKFRPEVILWLAVVALVFKPVPWGIDHLTYGVPMWVWQVLLVPPTVALAIAPLVGQLKVQRSSAPPVVATS